MRRRGDDGERGRRGIRRQRARCRAASLYPAARLSQRKVAEGRDTVDRGHGRGALPSDPPPGFPPSEGLLFPENDCCTLLFRLSRTCTTIAGAMTAPATDATDALGGTEIESFVAGPEADVGWTARIAESAAPVMSRATIEGVDPWAPIARPVPPYGDASVARVALDRAEDDRRARR